MRTLTHAAIACLAVVTIFGAGMRLPGSASAATVALKWGAPIEVAGVRPVGSATFFVYTSGTGALGLRLTGLAASGSYWVALYSGTCTKLGARVLVLPTVVATTNGTVTRGLTLNRALTTRVRTLLRGRLSVAIGSVRRCGTLARVSLAPSPTMTPTPTPTPTPTATPTPTPMPTPVPAPYDPGPPPPPYTY